jgi:hypothetical protein
MLCLEGMHNVSMWLGRMDVRERGFCRLFYYLMSGKDLLLSSL